MADNSQGLLTHEEMAIATTVTNTAVITQTQVVYDAYHRQQVVIYPDGSRVRTDYNSMGLPASLCDANSSNVCTGAYLVNGVEYDEAQRMTSIDFPASTGYSRAYTYYPWQNGTSSNANGRLAQSLLKEGSTERVKLAYDYDSFGNIIELTDTTVVTSTPQVLTEEMSYDFQNRLLEAYGLTNTWSSSGTDIMRPTQIEGKSFSYGGASMQPSSVGSHAFTWDANGNMLTREFLDVTGTERAQLLLWGRENRLSGVLGRGYDGNPLVESYRYSTDGVRLRKITNGVVTYYFSPLYTATASDTQRHYFFNGTRVAERKSSATEPIYRYGDQVDSSIYTSNNNTDENERYYAYGRTRSGGVETEYTFTGQMEDLSGLRYYNARYYDPNIGLFISPDTLIPDPGNLMDYNRYAYGRGNPVRNNDPTGHDPLDKTWQDEWHNKHGMARVITDADRQARLYSLAYDGPVSGQANWTDADWSYFNTRVGRVSLFMDSNAARASLDDFANAIQRLGSHYVEGEDEQFIWGIALLYAGVAYGTTFEEVIAQGLGGGRPTISVSQCQGAGERCAWLYHGMAGFRSDVVFNNEENTHHYAGHLLAGYYIYRPLAHFTAHAREYAQGFQTGGGTDSADILMGIYATEHASLLRYGAFGPSDLSYLIRSDLAP